MAFQSEPRVTNLDRLTSMSVFIKAADLGSFAAAAEALELSAPMVGKHVRFLEQRLGAQLINRTTRRQSLTDFGRAYYERCRAVLAESAAADALAADHLSRPHGKLRVTMPALFGRHCAAPILVGLAARHTALELELSFTDRLVDLMEEGHDLAIRTGTLADTGDLIARQLAVQEMVVCGSPDYFETNGTPQQMEELAAHQAIVYRRSGPAAPWLLPRSDGSLLTLLPKSRIRMDAMDAIADAAVDGLGVAWLPYWLVRNRIEAGTLVLPLPEARRFPYDVHAVWPRTPHLPLKVRLAIDELNSALPDLMR